MSQKQFYLIACLFFTLPVLAQNNVGIGVPEPTEALSIDRGMNVDHENQNAGSSLLNGIRFGNSSNPLQAVGISSNRAAVPNSFSLDFYTANAKRLTILQNGYVGINAVPTYMLEVGGTVKVSILRSAYSVVSENGNVNSAHAVTAGTLITAGTTITAGTDLIAEHDVKATNNIVAGDSLTATNDIITTNGDILAPAGELKAGGKGVIMSSNGTRQKIAYFVVNITANNLSSGGSISTTLNMPANTFTTPPTAYVGNVLVANGDSYKAMLVLENVTTTTVTVRIVNLTPSPITFNGAQWRIMAIGTF